MRRVLLATGFVALSSVAFVDGCGRGTPAGGSGCIITTTPFTVSPASGSANHMASPPGNEQQFEAASTTTYTGDCAIPNVVPAPYQTVWTTSDPVNTSISSAMNSTNGLATCLGATTVPATLTAQETAGSSITATATLSCN